MGAIYTTVTLEFCILSDVHYPSEGMCLFSHIFWGSCESPHCVSRSAESSIPVLGPTCVLRGLAREPFSFFLFALHCVLDTVRSRRMWTMTQF